MGPTKNIGLLYGKDVAYFKVTIYNIKEKHYFTFVIGSVENSEISKVPPPFLFYNISLFLLKAQLNFHIIYLHYLHCMDISYNFSPPWDISQPFYVTFVEVLACDSFRISATGACVLRSVRSLNHSAFAPGRDACSIVTPSPWPNPTHAYIKEIRHYGYLLGEEAIHTGAAQAYRGSCNSPIRVHVTYWCNQSRNRHA